MRASVRRGRSRSAKSYLAPSPPRVLAHRGFALDVPENTMLAFARALALGATHLETDVHVSSDGVAVISHDPDLTRLTGADGRIDEFTIAQLEKIDLGAGQAFTSLATALDTFPDARFNIDIKSMAAAIPTARAVIHARATDRVLITSFSGRRSRAALDLLPGVATSASSLRFAVALAAARCRLTSLFRRVLRPVDAVQIPERWRGVRIVDDALIRMSHAAGVEVHVWVVNDTARMRGLIAMGVDGLVTDRADLALQVLATIGPHRSF